MLIAAVGATAGAAFQTANTLPNTVFRPAGLRHLRLRPGPTGSSAPSSAADGDVNRLLTSRNASLPRHLRDDGAGPILSDDHGRGLHRVFAASRPLASCACRGSSSTAQPPASLQRARDLPGPTAGRPTSTTSASAWAAHRTAFPQATARRSSGSSADPQPSASARPCACPTAQRVEWSAQPDFHFAEPLSGRCGRMDVRDPGRVQVASNPQTT